MLRDRPLTRLERTISGVLAGITLAGGLFGMGLAVRTRDWRVGLAGAGVAAVGVLYGRAAWCGRPLPLNAAPTDGEQSAD
jgi:hypothetical protein